MSTIGCRAIQNAGTTSSLVGDSDGTADIGMNPGRQPTR
jgi:hypothetical protein